MTEGVLSVSRSGALSAELLQQRRRAHQECLEAVVAELEREARAAFNSYTVSRAWRDEVVVEHEVPSRKFLVVPWSTTETYFAAKVLNRVFLEDAYGQMYIAMLSNGRMFFSGTDVVEVDGVLYFKNAMDPIEFTKERDPDDQLALLQRLVTYVRGHQR